MSKRFMGVTTAVFYAVCFHLSLAAAQEKAPLELVPGNTVILHSAAATDAARLQYHLIRGFVGVEEAAPYLWDRKVDRAAAPWFPVIPDGAGVALPVDKNVIALGNTRFAASEDRARAQGDSGLIRRQGNVVVLLGRKAVPRFLDRLAGIRLYAPGELWLSAPREKKLTIPADYRDEFTPLLSWQSATGGYRAKADKAAGNRFGIQEWELMNGPAQLTLYAPHNVSNLFPPEKYGKTHPEIYEMHDGERRIPQAGTNTWHPCFSAKALPDLAMGAIRAQMVKNPRTAWISLFVMDIGMDCQCPACQESVKKHGDYSQLYHRFVIALADKCKKEFPDLLLTAAANYSSVGKPPQDGLRYPGNVAVKFVLKSYDFGTPGAADRLKAEIRQYSDLGAKWFAHDWLFGGPCPRQLMAQYAPFLQWAAQNGMVGTRIEWTDGEHWYLHGPKYWIMTRIYHDPYEDVNLLTRQYCQDMYGPASETMHRLFQHMADKFLYATDYITLKDLPRDEPALYSPDDLAYERQLLAHATKEAGDNALIHQRLDKVMRYFTCHELWAKACYMPAKLDRAWRGEGVNRDTLAYFATEEGNGIGEAIDFYENRCTEPPDNKDLEIRLGIEPTLIANYTIPKAKIVAQIRAEAMKKVDFTAIASAADVERYVEACKKILRANLPPKPLERRVKEFDSMLGRVAWAPRTDAMPIIDGDLGDAAWKRATPLQDFRLRDTLAQTPHTTEGAVMRVGDQLLIGLTCRQQGPIWARTQKDIATGTMIWRESGVEIVFGPTMNENPEAPYAQYVINVFGAYRGFREAADLRGATVAVKLDKDKGIFVIEAALPLRTEKYDYTKSKVLSFNISRLIYLSDSYFPAAMSGWAPIFGSTGLYYSRGLLFAQ